MSDHKRKRKSRSRSRDRHTRKKKRDDKIDRLENQIHNLTKVIDTLSKKGQQAEQQADTTLSVINLHSK